MKMEKRVKHKNSFEKSKDYNTCYFLANWVLPCNDFIPTLSIFLEKEENHHHNIIISAKIISIITTTLKFLLLG